MGNNSIIILYKPQFQEHNFYVAIVPSKHTNYPGVVATH